MPTAGSSIAAAGGAPVSREANSWTPGRPSARATPSIQPKRSSEAAPPTRVVRRSRGEGAGNSAAAASIRFGQSSATNPPAAGCASSAHTAGADCGANGGAGPASRRGSEQVEQAPDRVFRLRERRPGAPRARPSRETRPGARAGGRPGDRPPARAGGGRPRVRPSRARPPRRRRRRGAPPAARVPSPSGSSSAALPNDAAAPSASRPRSRSTEPMRRCSAARARASASRGSEARRASIALRQSPGRSCRSASRSSGVGSPGRAAAARRNVSTARARSLHRLVRGRQVQPRPGRARVVTRHGEEAFQPVHGCSRVAILDRALGQLIQSFAVFRHDVQDLLEVCEGRAAVRQAPQPVLGPLVEQRDPRRRRDRRGGEAVAEQVVEQDRSTGHVQIRPQEVVHALVDEGESSGRISTALASAVMASSRRSARSYAVAASASSPAARSGSRTSAPRRARARASPSRSPPARATRRMPVQAARRSGSTAITVP